MGNLGSVGSLDELDSVSNKEEAVFCLRWKATENPAEAGFGGYFFSSMNVTMVWPLERPVFISIKPPSAERTVCTSRFS